VSYGKRPTCTALTQPQLLACPPSMRAEFGCPFRNLPESRKGRWGEGLTAEEMKRCRWLKPQMVAAIEFLEWTHDNHLRHPKFVSLRDERDRREVAR